MKSIYPMLPAIPASEHEREALRPIAHKTEKRQQMLFGTRRLAQLSDGHASAGHLVGKGTATVDTRPVAGWRGTRRQRLAAAVRRDARLAEGKGWLAAHGATVQAHCEWP